MAKLVSNVYGDALFELALELDRIDEFTEEVNGIIFLKKPRLLSRF